MAAAALLTCLALPRSATAQTRISLGVGGGIAGSTDASLSNGRGGAVLMGQVTQTVIPFVGIGAEVDYWRRSVVSVSVATAIVQVHVPVVGLSARAGLGYGTGDPDGGGTTSGMAGQLGLGYDIGIPLFPIGFTLFGTGSLVHGSTRSIQLVDAGLALTF